MAKRPARPANVPWLFPYLTVKDAGASLGFYQRAFGFEKRVAMPGPDGKIAHAEMTYKDMVLMFGSEGAYGGQCKAPATTGTLSPVNVYVYCDDVDALYKRATAAGAKADGPPQDAFYGDRVCKLTDPDGHVWCFATNVADFDPAKVPH
jgi:uncharacterized glyoxalase superfamily protein PhnB